MSGVRPDPGRNPLLSSGRRSRRRCGTAGFKRVCPYAMSRRGVGPDRSCFEITGMRDGRGRNSTGRKERHKRNIGGAESHRVPTRTPVIPIEGYTEDQHGLMGGQLPPARWQASRPGVLASTASNILSHRGSGSRRPPSRSERCSTGTLCPQETSACGRRHMSAPKHALNLCLACGLREGRTAHPDWVLRVFLRSISAWKNSLSRGGARYD